MAKYQILKGSTDVSIDVFIQSTAVTTGAGLTGLAFNTASLSCYYHRPGSNAAQLTLATQTVTGAHSDGGFVEIDATNMPGFYRLDLSDAIVASGVNFVSMQLKGAANMAQLPLEIELVAYNPQDAVRMGMTALPNAAAEAAGGLYTRGSGAGQINQQANGQVDTNLARWLNTAPLALSSQQVQAIVPDTQKVDVNTIKTNPVVNAGTITFPTTATLASTTNITAGTLTTVSGNVNGSVGSVTGNVEGNLVGDVQGNVVGDVLGEVAALSTAANEAIADEGLTRDWTMVGAPADRSTLNALRFLRNKWSIVGGVLDVTEEDDTTSAWTGAVTQTAGDPVSAIDPT